MGDDITIGVTEIVNNIEVTAQPNDQIVDISVTDNADNVTLNITPTVVEVNINKGSSFAQWGDLYGTLSDQTDLQNALNLKANLVDGKVPASELPSYVDDIIEVANYAALPATGEIGKIYVTLDNNKIYRWSGSIYIEIASNSAIWGAITGTLSSQTDLQNALNAKEPTITAGTTSQYYRGDKTFQTLDKTAVGLGNVDNTSDLNKPISTATQTALNAKQNTITLTTTGTTGAATLVGSTLNVPNYTTDISGLVPYTGATGNVDLGSHKLTASDLVINHASGSGVSASITKGGNGEALTVVKSSGSGNAASITGGTTLISELHLTTDLADDYIASAATWNAKQNALNGTGFVKISGTTISYDNTTYLSGTVAIANGGTGATTAAAALTNLGGTTVGTNIFTSANPSPYTSAYLKVKPDNSVEWLEANAFRIAIGAGTGNGTVTSVEAVGSYGGLTLTGTVTGSGQITLGGTPEGTWPISITGNAASVSTVQVSTNADFYLTFADANNGSPTSEFLYTIGSVKVNPSTGALTAGSFVKSGGTSSQFLMADGSVSTGSGGTVTGTGTTNYIPKFTGASAIGNSLIYDNGTNVGIGTTSPSAKLHVVGSSEVFRLGTTNSLNYFTFLNSSGTQIGDIGYDGRDTDILSIWNNSNGGMLFGTNATERMRITSSGNVGVGTTVAYDKLTLGGGKFYLSYAAGADIGGTIYSYNNTGYQPYAGGLKFQVFRNETGAYLMYDAMTLDAAGRLAIGTTNNIHDRLHIQNGSAANTTISIQSWGTEAAGEYAGIRFKSATTSNNEYGKGFIGFRNNGTGYGRGDLYFCLNNSTDTSNAGLTDSKVVITSGGNVLIGTTTDAGYKLDVNGTGRFSGTVDATKFISNVTNNYGFVLNRSATNTYNGMSLQTAATPKWFLGMRENLTSNNYIIYSEETAQDVLTLNVGTNAATFIGTVTATGFFNSSDNRLKELIDYDYNVSDIKPITYLWKDGRDDRKHVGYSAQEVQKVMPDAVNEDSDGMLSVNYVEVLVAKIAELENRIKQLEK